MDVLERLIAALEPDDVVLGGGDVKKLKKLPPGCRASDNASAFTAGFRRFLLTTHHTACKPLLLRWLSIRGPSGAMGRRV